MSAHLTRRLRLAAALLVSLACLAGYSPDTGAIQLNGRIDVQASSGGGAAVYFNCEGENPCRGTYVAAMRNPECTNDLPRIDSIILTGLNLASPGPISGSVTLVAISNDSVQRHADGSCSAKPTVHSDFAAPFTGTWDGTSATLVFPVLSESGGDTLTLSGRASVVSRLWQVSGSISGTGTPPVGGTSNLQLSFSCQGENPCTGTATGTFLDRGCSNAFTISGAFGIAEWSLSQPGPISGGLVVRNGDYQTVLNADGTCTMSPSGDGGGRFTGSWNGSSGSLQMTDSEIPISGSISGSATTVSTAVSTPVFPMTVTTNITPTASSATASVPYWTQGPATTGNVYAFAMAPATIVRAASAKDTREEDTLPPLGFAKRADGTKDTSVACVLAQLNASGQLVQASASSLQAYVTGVLSSASQSVQVLNGVATANIGGATFYVGYGTDSTAMVNSGINRSVVTVPGAQLCQPERPQTGWWWNQAEDGRGYTIESTAGNKIFFAAYLYDVSGRSTWYISAGRASLDGSLFVGNLESYSNGQTLTGAFRSPVRPPVLNGQLTLAFSNSTHGTLIWPGGTVPITRMEFGVGGVNAVPQANQPESGWWLSGLDDGRGFFIEWQAGVAFMAGFMYDDTGAPVWYIAANPRSDNARVFSSQWEKYVNGQTLTGTYHPPVRPPTYVGAATIQFQGAADAIMTMPGGRQVTLSRYRF